MADASTFPERITPEEVLDRAWRSMSPTLRRRAMEVAEKFTSEELETIATVTDPDIDIAAWAGTNQKLIQALCKAIPAGALPKIRYSATGQRYPQVVSSSWEEFTIPLAQAAIGKRDV